VVGTFGRVGTAVTVLVGGGDGSVVISTTVGTGVGFTVGRLVGARVGVLVGGRVGVFV
jgi:hypothetical protein